MSTHTPEAIDFDAMLKQALVTYDEVIDSITPKEASIWRLRYPRQGRGLTMELIGQEFQVTRQRISQIVAKIRRKLMYPSRADRIQQAVRTICHEAKSSGQSLNDLRLMARRLDMGFGVMFYIYSVAFEKEQAPRA